MRTAETPLIFRAGAILIDLIRACGCGERRVDAHNIPSAQRSLENAKSPVTFSVPSGRATLSPIPALTGTAM